MGTIYQDWTPVDIGNRKKTNNNNNNNNRPKPKVVEDPETGMMPKIKTFPLDLINNIKNTRESKKITQKDLAKLMSMESSIINKIENSQYPFNEKLYNEIMRKMGVNPKEIKKTDDKPLNKD